MITPPLPEIVASAPAAELAATELAGDTLELLVGDGELDCCTDERTDDAADELDDTATLVAGDSTDDELTALGVVVAAGSEPPQPDTNTAATAAAAINGDLDARVFFTKTSVTAGRSLQPGPCSAAMDPDQWPW